MTPGERRQNAARLEQVVLQLGAALEGGDRRVLNRRRHRGVGFTGHRGHGLAQPVQVVRKGEGAQPPAAGAAPFAQPAADDGALRVVAGNGLVRAVIVQLAVDLVAEQNQTVAPGHLGQRPQLLFVEAVAVGVGRRIEDHQTRAPRIPGAQIFQGLGGGLPAVGAGGRQPVHLAPDDARLRRVGHPAGRGDHQVAVIDQLQDEHQLLGTGADHDVVRGKRHALPALPVAGHGPAQGRQPQHRQVILGGGVLAQGADHGGRHRKRRLPQPELEHRAPPGKQFVTEFVDGEGGGHPQATDIEVEVNAGVELRGHRRGLLAEETQTPTIPPLGADETA